MKVNHKKVMAIVITVAILFYSIYTFFNKPNEDSIHIACMSKTVFGLNCAGCGMTRFIYYLMHFNIIQALSFNVFGFPIIITILAIYIYFIRWSFWNKEMPQIPLWLAYSYIICVILFTILRNIPYPPFTYLMPG